MKSTHTRRRLEDADLAARKEAARKIAAEHPGELFTMDDVRRLYRALCPVVWRHVPDPASDRPIVDAVARLVSERRVWERHDLTAAEARLIQRAGAAKYPVFTARQLRALAEVVVDATDPHLDGAEARQRLRREIGDVLRDQGIELPPDCAGICDR